MAALFFQPNTTSCFEHDKILFDMPTVPGYLTKLVCPTILTRWCPRAIPLRAPTRQYQPRIGFCTALWKIDGEIVNSRFDNTYHT